MDAAAAVQLGEIAHELEEAIGVAQFMEDPHAKRDTPARETCVLHGEHGLATDGVEGCEQRVARPGEAHDASAVVCGLERIKPLAAFRREEVDAGADASDFGSTVARVDLQTPGEMRVAVEQQRQRVFKALERDEWNVGRCGGLFVDEDDCNWDSSVDELVERAKWNGRLGCECSPGGLRRTAYRVTPIDGDRVCGWTGHGGAVVGEKSKQSIATV